MSIFDIPLLVVVSCVALFGMLIATAVVIRILNALLNKLIGEAFEPDDNENRSVTEN